MGFLGIYILVALVTALTAYFSIFSPSMKKAQAAQINNTLTRHPKVSSGVFIIVALVVAPAFLFALFHPETYTRIVAGLDKSMLEIN